MLYDMDVTSGYAHRLYIWDSFARQVGLVTLEFTVKLSRDAGETAETDAGARETGHEKVAFLMFLRRKSGRDICGRLLHTSTTLFKHDKACLTLSVSYEHEHGLSLCRGLPVISDGWRRGSSPQANPRGQTLMEAVEFSVNDMTRQLARGERDQNRCPRI